MTSKIPVGSIWVRETTFGQIRIRITSTSRFDVWFKYLNDDGSDMDMSKMHVSDSMPRKLLLAEFKLEN